jgi:membrane protein insertase Oxa1/YidC/SpoIIIJ
MSDNPETKVPSKENNEMKVKDDNPDTFLNENLWKKFAFKFLSYLFYIIGQSIVLVPFLGWSWTIFITGLTSIIMPLVWSTLDAQARNKEIQLEFKAKQEMEAKVAEWATEKDALVSELEEVRKELNDKCITLAANEKALEIVKNQ